MVETCTRCEGNGSSPIEPGKLCKECYGAGVAGPDFNYRSDGRVERICSHGVGHTVCVKGVSRATLDFDSDGEAFKRAWYAHGCDGCCGEYERYE